MLGLHYLDTLVLILYFLVILYVGVFKGGKETKNLKDFFIAGGKWGPAVSFIFVFASAIAGNEAVVVAKGGYTGGLSGVWYWWSFLFATPVYFLFSTYFKRARVYNLSEFLEMRYGRPLASFYSLVAGVLCVLYIGMFLLAIGKILAGMIEFHPDFSSNVSICIWAIALIVGAYVGTGGMMSALLTDILQGLMCLFILGFIGLPFLWSEVGGFESLQALPKETWSMSSESMTWTTILALNVAALTGGIAAPWIFNWISISRDEKAATQTGWGHFWKRIITLVFAIYGILFMIYNTNILAIEDPALAQTIAQDPEVAWGIVMKRILPPVFLGLLVASFFAAAMSSADTYATTSSAMFVDHLYRKVVKPGKSERHYLTSARVWVIVSILIAAISTGYIGTISQYIKLTFNLMCFLGVPIYFGVVWKRSNRTGAWVSFVSGIGSYIIIVFYTAVRNNLSFVEAIDPAFEVSVFVSAAFSIMGMAAGSYLGQLESESLIKKFHVILNTPIGQEQRLIDAGIALPALGNEEAKEDTQKIDELYNLDAEDKLFGVDSSVELRREKTLPWYFPGFIRITIACFALILITWGLLKVLF
jgi:Na+/proline symporter